MFLWKKLYSTIDSHRVGLSNRELAKQGGFSPSLLTRLAQGKAISVNNLFRVVKSTLSNSDLFTFYK